MQIKHSKQHHPMAVVQHGADQNRQVVQNLLVILGRVFHLVVRLGIQVEFGPLGVVQDPMVGHLSIHKLLKLKFTEVLVVK
jgi:hypothetical protein